MASNIKNLWNDEVLGIVFDAQGIVNGEIAVSMPGIFNAENALVAVALAGLCGVSAQNMSAALKKVSVKGRTQLIRETAHFATFIIDYGFVFASINIQTADNVIINVFHFFKAWIIRSQNR